MIYHQRAWHGGVYTHFIPQGSCFHIPILWAVVVVIQSAICWHLWADVYPSTRYMEADKPFCPGRHPCPLHITWNLHLSSVYTLVDVHRRSHSFPFIHPREVFLAWCWVITSWSSSCGVVLLSLPPGVGLTGVGLVHPSHTWWTATCKGMPTSDAMRRSWLQHRRHEFPCWSFTSYEGMSLMIWCTTSWGLSSYLSTIFLFLWKASALTRTRSPDFKPTVSSSGHNTTSVFELLPWIGLGPLEEWPSSGLIQ